MAAIVTLILSLSLISCNSSGNGSSAGSSTAGTGSSVPSSSTASSADASSSGEKKGVAIIYTSDVHCGIDQGFGYAGLSQVRSYYQAQGYETILVDDGDSIQGEPVGTLSKGDAIIDLMNDLKYDVVIPGNHEFDYGMDQFLSLTKKAEFPYISCNFTYKDELVFKPYIIKEAAGMKIAFVGVTTPESITSSAPAYFEDESGNMVYGFMQDNDGTKLYSALQKAVDSARAEGADFVYVLAHLGNEADCHPWTFSDVISHTSGIDVLLDGHSHDLEQVVTKDKDGKDVPRSAVGTKLNAIGYSVITADKKISETKILTWESEKKAPDILGIKNEMSTNVDAALKDMEKELQKVVAKTDVDLTIDYPDKKDEDGKPVRAVRRAETNMGDLCTDALRIRTGADIGMLNGGGIRDYIKKGDVTYGDIISVHPYGNQICVIEATGQQILDALEWGARVVPEESGSFLHVSGMSYEIDATFPSTCKTDENRFFAGVSGKRRVKNVKVGDKPIDPAGKYTIAGIEYIFMNKGDGFTCFDGAKVVKKDFAVDDQLLIDYIVDNLKGSIGSDYADPKGQGRIKITQ